MKVSSTSMDNENNEFSSESNGRGKNKNEPVDGKSCPSNDDILESFSGLQIKGKPTCNSSNDDSNLTKGAKNGDKSLDNEDVKGMVIVIVFPTLMMKATKVMMMKVVTGYKKKEDTNVRDESSCLIKFHNS